jgi:FlaA1/EpsC-like NDP-sugar epimerase
MIRLSGSEPGEAIAIQYIGLRPGEKLYEELFYDSEDLIPTRHPKIRVARGGDGLIGTAVEERVAALEHAAAVGDRSAMADMLRTMLPGWHTESDTDSLARAEVHDRRNADA